MKEEAYSRQAPLPAAVHQTTGALLSLSQWKDDPGAAADSADLSLQQQIDLVTARWRAGAWHDIYYGTEGEVDVDRAIREVEAQSDMGRHLLAIGLRAIEMAREDAGQGEQG